MRIALAQVTPDDDAARNAELACGAIREAAAAGAALVVLPEATLAPFGTDLGAAAREHAASFDRAITEAAEGADVIVVVGSLSPAEDGRTLNTLLVRGRGLRVDYDKIHLYDAFGTRESDSIAPGEGLHVIDLGELSIGLATCYDVRFPEQFRALAAAGADAIVLPAAWAGGEGKAEQWELLIRARALDSTAYVLACDQAPPAGARDPRGVGRSAVVDPRGRILDILDEQPGMLIAEIETARVAAVRETLPVLEHGRALPAVQHHGIQHHDAQHPRTERAGAQKA